jgi:hypothetical protein
MKSERESGAGFDAVAIAVPYRVRRPNKRGPGKERPYRPGQMRQSGEAAMLPSG